MKRMLIALIGLLLPLGLVLVPATPAQADTPGCVDRWEYRHVYRHMSSAMAHQRFDTAGTMIARRATGYYEEVFNERAYDRAYNEWLSWEPSVDDDYYLWDIWFDSQPDSLDYYYNRWVSQIDMVRSYKKCRSFGGGGRIGVWYDNYTSAYSGMRIWKKSTRPYVLRSEMLWWWNIWMARQATPNPKS